MTYEELKRIGQELSAEEVTATVRQLMADRRLGALVRMLEDLKEQTADASCQLKFAPQHGCLEHAAGVRYALLEVKGKMDEVQRVKVKTKRARGEA